MSRMAEAESSMPWPAVIRARSVSRRFPDESTDGVDDTDHADHGVDAPPRFGPKKRAVGRADLLRHTPERDHSLVAFPAKPAVSRVARLAARRLERRPRHENLGGASDTASDRALELLARELHHLEARTIVSRQRRAGVGDRELDATTRCIDSHSAVRLESDRHGAGRPLARLVHRPRACQLRDQRCQDYGRLVSEGREDDRAAESADTRRATPAGGRWSAAFTSPRPP